MIRINGKIFILALMICAAALIGASSAFCKQNHEEILKQNIMAALFIAPNKIYLFPIHVFDITGANSE